MPSTGKDSTGCAASQARTSTANAAASGPSEKSIGNSASRAHAVDGEQVHRLALGGDLHPVPIVRLGRSACRLVDGAVRDHLMTTRGGDVRPDPGARGEIGIAAPGGLA